MFPFSCVKANRIWSPWQISLIYCAWPINMMLNIRWVRAWNLWRSTSQWTIFVGLCIWPFVITAASCVTFVWNKSDGIGCQRWIPMDFWKAITKWSKNWFVCIALNEMTTFYSNDASNGPNDHANEKVLIARCQWIYEMSSVHWPI